MTSHAVTSGTLEAKHKFTGKQRDAERRVAHPSISICGVHILLRFCEDDSTRVGHFEV